MFLLCRQLGSQLLFFKHCTMFLEGSASRARNLITDLQFYPVPSRGDHELFEKFVCFVFSEQSNFHVRILETANSAHGQLDVFIPIRRTAP